MLIPLMRTPRQTTIRRAILTSLAHLPAGYMLPTDLLQRDVARLVPQEPTTSEFEAELRAADTEHLIVGIAGEDAIRWKNTDSGRAWLAEHP